MADVAELVRVSFGCCIAVGHVGDVAARLRPDAAFQYLLRTGWNAAWYVAGNAASLP